MAAEAAAVSGNSAMALQPSSRDQSVPMGAEEGGEDTTGDLALEGGVHLHGPLSSGSKEDIQLPAAEPFLHEAVKL